MHVVKRHPLTHQTGEKETHWKDARQFSFFSDALYLRARACKYLCVMHTYIYNTRARARMCIQKRRVLVRWDREWLTSAAAVAGIFGAVVVVSLQERESRQRSILQLGAQGRCRRGRERERDLFCRTATRRRGSFSRFIVCRGSIACARVIVRVNTSFLMTGESIFRSLVDGWFIGSRRPFLLWESLCGVGEM